MQVKTESYKCIALSAGPFHSPALDATVILLGQKLKHNYTESEQLPMGCTSMFVPPQIQYHQDGFSHVYVHAWTGCCREENIFSASHMKCPFGVQPRLSCGSSKMAAILVQDLLPSEKSPPLVSGVGSRLPVSSPLPSACPVTLTTVE